NGELRVAILAAAERLSPRRREAFTLVHIHGLSNREVAEIMDVRPQTVANYLQAAIADLRVALKPFFPSFQ
ncbi:MAG TPA: sigma-70 region 4 domain-containing protein, partial [Longimicrobiales bacterium]|nr:sigma-70 region 4 domain-containing protein [Longimicrobiales bacterium]